MIHCPEMTKLILVCIFDCMCGIAGWLTWGRGERDGAEIVGKMLAEIECRGPDSSGIWQDMNIQLGHCRLAIIDPAAGRQPMVSAIDEHLPVVLSFGGEIYNHVQLRRQLEALGQRFATRSDTEVILRAYHEWGDGFVKRLRGMFSIALWDSRKKILLLARDALGVKPLFFRESSDDVIFASEPKSLLAHPEVEPELDAAGLAQLLGLWPYRSPGHGIFRGISEVRPGELIVFQEHATRRTRFWRLQAQPHDDDAETTAGRLFELLNGIVPSYMQSDYPISFLLSGGLDSSGLVSISSKMWDHASPMRTFSVDYQNSGSTFAPTLFRPNRDSPYVQYVSSLFNTLHTEVLLALSHINEAEERTLRARDFPDTGDMDASLLLLFERVSKEYRVCISGEGADELFGGYPWFSEALTTSLMQFPWRPYLCFPADFVSQGISQEIDLEGYVAQKFADAVRKVPRLDGESGSNRNLRVMTYLDLTQFLPGQLERKDRASMACGVEARVPYCDQDLVQYAWNIPGSMKAAGGIEKGILRMALRNHLPIRVCTRRKASYPTLMDPGYENYLRASVHRLLAEPDWPLAAVIDTEQISRVLDGGAPPRSRSSVWLGRIWSLYRWSMKYNPTLV